MIEKAKPEYMDRIMELWLHTNLSAHSFIPKAYWENAFESVKEAMPAADIFVYTESDIVVGFIGITDGWYIAGLFIDEQSQSQGIGRKLLDYCKKNYPRLELDVFLDNTGAVRFYETNGFEIAATAENTEFGCVEHHMTWNAPK